MQDQSKKYSSDLPKSIKSLSVAIMLTCSIFSVFATVQSMNHSYIARMNVEKMKLENARDMAIYKSGMKKMLLMLEFESPFDETPTPKSERKSVYYAKVIEKKRAEKMNISYAEYKRLQRGE